MKVKALKRLNVDGVHIEAGEEVTLPAERAKAAIEIGIAVSVEPKKPGYETKEEKKFE